ncbi:MAG: exopolyphosphatase [Rhodospirillales bacterium]|jgi:hypothetical protein|nr:exopolyphosphatase [Rhodospirillales bacterium]
MSEEKSNFRLVTRGDFDGIVSGSLLSERQLVSEVVFAHPRDVQSGVFTITSNDIIANLPYSELAHMCFSHHHNASFKSGEHDNLVSDIKMLSTARVIYNYFGGFETFPEVSEDMLQAVDKAGSANYEVEDTLIPSGWTLLNFILDPRTGLEEFKTFNVSRDVFMTDLIAFCKRSPIEEILSHPDVEERLTTFQYYNEFAELQISRCAEVHDKTVLVNFRDEEKHYPGNRFMVYGLFPQCNLSIHLSATDASGITEISAGKSIIDTTSKINVGDLMYKYGGGGHSAAGTCRVEDSKVDTVVSEILNEIQTTVN